MGYRYPLQVDSLVDAPKKHSMGKPTKVLVYVYAVGPVRESTSIPFLQADWHTP